MLINRFVIRRYATLLTKFERSTNHPTSQQVLDLLLVRDAVQGALNGSVFGTAARLEKVKQLDKRLKEQGKAIVNVVELDDYRATVCPASDAWWWFFDREPADLLSGDDNSATLLEQSMVNATGNQVAEQSEISIYRRGFSWLLNGFTFVLLIISMGFLVDIGLRFLVDRFDLITVLPVLVDAVVGALIAMLALRTRLNYSDYRWLILKLAFALSFLLAVYFFHQNGLPYLANYYHTQARIDLEMGQLQGAQAKYQVAINLNPNYVEAHYNLGSLSEELFDFDRARAEYRMAILQGFAPAYNNLARLHILEEEYSEAVTWLLKGLQVVEYDEVRYDMLKNLAWARIGQGRYAEAKPYLTEALEITEEKAPAHCLLAQVLDGQEKKVEADARWESCLRRASEYNPDEDRWIGMMRNRATKEGNE